jgi:hypothetical protein
MKKIKKITIIGSGFSTGSFGVFSAKRSWCYGLWKTQQLEASTTVKQRSFTFDMGPSWTGCQMFSNVSLLILKRKQLIIMNSLNLFLRTAYYGIDDFISIATICLIYSLWSYRKAVKSWMTFGWRVKLRYRYQRFGLPSGVSPLEW